MKPPLSRVAAVLVAACVLGPSITWAQSFPNRPIRVVIETTTGSTNDIWSRRFGQRLGEALGQPIVVDNKPGASGTIAAEQVARAAADGHTLLFGGMASLITFPAASGAVRYQPGRDFVPIALGTMGYPLVLASAKLGVKSLPEFVAWTKTRSEEVTCGTAGIASPQHFACSEFARAVGVKARAIPYKGGAAAMLDAVTGEVALVVAWSSEAAPFTENGRLVPLVTLGPKRHPRFPDVPTTDEAGYRAVLLPAFSGLFAPVGTPPEIIARLNAEMVKAATRPEMKEWMDANGGIYMPMDASEFATFFRQEQAKWKRLADEGNIRAE
jgi:tripartite-type tricarboxylate transporter receptor subunit TctC